MKESTREWVGVANTDLIIYAAWILLIVIFYTNNLFLITLLSIVAVALNAYGSRHGSKPKKDFSKTLNKLKKILNPVTLYLLILFIIIRYVIYFL